MFHVELNKIFSKFGKAATVWESVEEVPLTNMVIDAMNPRQHEHYTVIEKSEMQETLTM